MLPLSLPQLPIPPLPLPKLPLPPIPFSMELPLLPPVVMQSVALQPQPWLDSSVNPELAKLYQSQLNPALLGQQPQLSPALLAQQPQLSPALLGQPPQLNPALLGQPSQPSPIQTGQQSQVSPTIPEQQQGKRTRTRISEEQLAVLKKHFNINSLPNDEEINKMVIVVWFQNARQRARKNQDRAAPPPSTTAAPKDTDEPLPVTPAQRLLQKPSHTQPTRV
uniref:Homeobox domain-containing protein n=1 Tax=Amphilophus citrinellus TaxID=61819 RepID=A0A3Q0TBI9_AMPCI